MPELPEVERLRQSLLPHVLGARVTRARLLRADVLERGAGAPRAASLALLEGGLIVQTLRRGKHLALVDDQGRALLVHLGMSGQVLVRPEGDHAKDLTHVHARWTLTRSGAGARTDAHAADAGSCELLFRDPRRFGGLWSYPSVEALHAQRWDALGPDALDVTGEHLASTLHASQRAVKVALLDQGVLAGVGNIYADEALAGAGIDPRRWCATLRPDDWERLATTLRGVLRVAIEAGGSTLRDYVDADGAAGRAGALHRVYGRGGEACLTCGTPLLTTRLAQRTTVWCPACQG